MMRLRSLPGPLSGLIVFVAALSLIAGAGFAARGKPTPAGDNANILAVLRSSMAITSVGSVGTNQVKTAGTGWTVANLASPWSQNDLVVVMLAFDNLATSDGESTTVTAADLKDAAGGFHALTKLGEFTNAQAGASAGSTVWLGFRIAPFDGDDVEFAFSSSVTAKAISVWHFTVDAGSDVHPAASIVTLANDNADPGSMSNGSNRGEEELLFLRAIAGETASATALTPTTGWTALGGNQTSGAADASNMAVRGEFRIITTAVNQTSDPTWVASDAASILAVIHETSWTVPRRDRMGSVFPTHVAVWE